MSRCYVTLKPLLNSGQFLCNNSIVFGGKNDSDHKYLEEQREQALKELEACGDINLVSRKLNIPTHAIYRFRREKLKSQVSQAQEIKRLTKARLLTRDFFRKNSFLSTPSS